MTSVLCGQPTPNGPCRRPVKAPGAPCGATHTDQPTSAAAAGPPAGTGPGPDPLNPPAGDYSGTSFDQEMRDLAATAVTCHYCGEPVGGDGSEGVYVHLRDHPGAYDADEGHAAVPVTDIDEADSTLVKNWFRHRRPTHPDWDDHAATFPAQYAEWFDEIDTIGDHDARWADEADILDIYADHPNWRVAAAAAANPHTAPATLERLAGHDHPDARAAAAANPNCPTAARAHAGLLAD